jgi:hypothetical protein
MFCIGVMRNQGFIHHNHSMMLSILGEQPLFVYLL